MAHILLIEPDRILAKIYSAFLVRQGKTVGVAAGAQEAVHGIDSQKPDVVILELQLAGHNGVEFLYELRSYPEWQDIPVILHTLVQQESLKLSTDLLQAMGVIRYLYKPATSLLQLGMAVGGVLDRPGPYRFGAEAGQADAARIVPL